MAEQALFIQCLRERCGLSADEATAIVRQGYNTAANFRMVDQEGLKELFTANVRLESMTAFKKQKLRAGAP